MNASANPPFPLSEETASLRRSLVYSLLLHVSLAAAVAVSVVARIGGEQWAGLGGAKSDSVEVTLVRSAGVPMPPPPEITDSKTFDPTESLYKETPQPKPPEPPKPEIKIPQFKKEKPLPPSPKSRVFENKTPVPDNAAPSHGGQANLHTGYQQTPGVSSSGVQMPGDAGGQFATRYGWYIAAARRRVQPNWDQLSIDPAVRNSRTLHCVVSFNIMHDGSVKNVRIYQSSGNTSWDNAGLRAILSSNPFSPLPSDWSPPDVSVLWDFPDAATPQ
jgi:TonB family protein